MVGNTVSHYRVLEKLGEGGMGEVYVAYDTALNRRVALKTLPPTLAADPERRQRFEREARAVAALTHPNIVTIYSVEQTNGVLFLTMELVEGKTLWELIPKDGLPLETILKYAIPLTDAVCAAHQRGITHRDLKPANVMVTPEGRVKVLDFGLVKLREPALLGESVAALPTKELTREGRILGTVAYMSPEQAEGKDIDHRTDIFSLGVLLYELATGELPFKGDSPISTLSSILRDTPRQVTEIRRTLPREFGRIVRRCLAKDPEARYQTAKDFRNDLIELKQALDSGELTAAVVPMVAAPAGKGTSRRHVLAVALSGGVVAALLGVYSFVRPSKRAGEFAPASAPASFTQLTAQPGLEQFPSISPDGKWIVYTSDARGKEDIYFQSVGGRTPINLTENSDAADYEPAFSPSGERIVFRSDRQGGGIFVMGRTGESPTRISDTGWNPAWSPDGKEVVYATQNADHPFTRATISELWAVQVTTGEKRRITEGDAVQPSWSPHGNRIAYWAVPATSGQRDIWTIPAAGGRPTAVTNDMAVDWSPVWSPDGRFIYFSSDRGGSMNLWRVPVDEKTGDVLGSPQSLTTPTSFVAQVSLSADGQRLVYASLAIQSNIAAVGFDPVVGKIVGEPAAVTQGTRFWWAPEPSPDGESVAFNAFMPEDIYISRPDGRDLRQLTDDPASDRNPHWAPDGKRITFYSTRSGTYNIWSVNPDGSGLHQVTFADYALFGGNWSPDGLRMGVTDLRTGRPRSLIFDPNRPWRDQTPQILPPPRPGVTTSIGTWSPDGKRVNWANYIYSFESGKFESLAAPAAPGRNARSILAPGTGPPAWLNDSRRIVVSVGGKLFLVDTLTKQSSDLLSRPAEALNYPTLSRDNRRLYFTRGSVEGDIWMATLK